MSQRNKQPLKKGFPLKTKTKQSPQLQPQIEKTLAHLETILMVAQLNSTYFKSQLNLQKMLNSLEHNYFKTKMNAFLAIQNYRYDQVEVNSKRVEYETSEWKKKMASVSDDLQFNFEEQSLETIYRKCKKNVDCQQISVSTHIKCSFKLQRMIQILKLKEKRQLSTAFYKLEQHREISMGNVYSEKSSKIETNDSQKSKIFQRSIEKKDNRKSFSLQKSGLSPKQDYYVPVKYQPSKVTNQLTVNTQNRQLYFSQVSSPPNKFLQNVADKTKERRNNLQINRQKKQTKHSSTKKYVTNMALQKRQQKVKQLEYLCRKYKKIVDEFCWFSQRFLKVIEEEDYVQ